jgi:hypothetical protein
VAVLQAPATENSPAPLPFLIIPCILPYAADRVHTKEFACFSYDDKHEFHLGDSSMRWYYPPEVGADLSEGFETFDKHDDSVDEHLDSLLKTIIAHEQAEGKKIDAQIVTWRGMMTKAGRLAVFSGRMLTSI